MQRSVPLFYLITLCLLLGCEVKSTGHQAEENSESIQEAALAEEIHIDVLGPILEAYPQIDVHIKGGLLIDGSGAPAQEGDVLIVKDTIIYAGPVEDQVIEATQVIDATGKVVTPGFIDLHAHGDPVRRPAFQNFLAMGVTTIVLGQDGRSTPKRNMDAWFTEVDRKKPGPNIATFIGHGTLREMSGVGFRKEAGIGLEKMQTQLADGLKAGAWGMSTGLEYRPGSFAQEDELQALAQTVGENNGMIMSHIRNEDDGELVASLDELLRQGQHCPVHVSHIKSVYGKGAERAQQILAQLDSARQTGIQVTADLYPYTASFTTIGIVFPDWARPPNNYSRVRQLKQAQLETYLRERVMRRNGPESTLFGTAPYAGKTLEQVAQEKGKPFEKVLMEDIGPRGASAAYFVMDETLQQTLLQDPFVMVCSDGSPSMRHPRGYGSFARIIETYVRERGLFSLEEAVRKMTSMPAQTIGFQDRGVLEAGKMADVLVFDPAAVHATATFPQPHLLAEGFDYVIVNGRIVKERKTWAAKRAGRVLRKAAR